MRNTGLDEAQVGIKIARRSINNFRYADDNTLMAESEEELNSLLMKVKKESEKADLKLNIQKTDSWQIDGEAWKQSQTFFPWVPKSLQMVTAAMKLKDACYLDVTYVKRQSPSFLPTLEMMLFHLSPKDPET